MTVPPKDGMMPYSRLAALVAISALSTLSVSATGCLPGDLLGSGGDAGQRRFEPDYSLQPPAHRAELPCGDEDPANLCIALRYVAYKGASSYTTVSRTQAAGNVDLINSVWSQCGIEFYVEDYQLVDAPAQGLTYQPAHEDELNTIRERFADDSRMLVVSTGSWSGELGAQGPNAWTVLPPVGPFGVVLEGRVALTSNLIAHELGHYLNLEHEQDVYNAMNPVIYSNSVNLLDAQCAEARATAISFWGQTLR